MLVRCRPHHALQLFFKFKFKGSPARARAPAGYIVYNCSPPAFDPLSGIEDLLRQLQTEHPRAASVAMAPKKVKALSRWTSQDLVLFPLAFAVALCTIGIMITLYETDAI